MENCLFCKIVKGDIPSTKVYEDEKVLAFRDIAPMAPTHILVIPKTHIPSVDGITAENSAVVAHIFEVIPQIAKAENLEKGYRVISNCGEHAGQTVPHLHFHILGKDHRLKTRPPTDSLLQQFCAIGHKQACLLPLFPGGQQFFYLLQQRIFPGSNPFTHNFCTAFRASVSPRTTITPPSKIA
jgi:histidine triad (HIT) family protein